MLTTLHTTFAADTLRSMPLASQSELAHIGTFVAQVDRTFSPQEMMRLTVVRRAVRARYYNNDTLPIQCAWCHTIQDGLGEYTIHASENYTLGTPEHPMMSHGICPPCGTRYLAEAGLAWSRAA